MGYVIIHNFEEGKPHKLKWYKTLKGLKIALRAWNRNAGWEHKSWCYDGTSYLSWSAEKAPGDNWEYAPYIGMSETNYEKAYG